MLVTKKDLNNMILETKTKSEKIQMEIQNLTEKFKNSTGHKDCNNKTEKKKFSLDKKKELRKLLIYALQEDIELFITKLN